MIDISKEITDAVRTYTNDVKEGLQEAQKDVSKETVKDLKGTSPKDTGDYAKGWRAKKTKRGYVVHNATDYQLTHLLEKGHAKRGGGRVAAIPHIAPAEQRAIDDYENRVEKVIRG
ncbi:HK97 gp10 family phage protein [Virgibacillus salexigens]|uniref:HK97 gp10 family phage protein n=1 Tax=Virgibacillus salexigens TaxID=61016 RepID=UPI0030812027